MKASFKKGQVFSADYRSGSLHHYYTVFPADNQSEQRKYDAALKYFQSHASKFNPILDEFERLSKQLPLK